VILTIVVVVMMMMVAGSLVVATHRLDASLSLSLSLSHACERTTAQPSAYVRGSRRAGRETASKQPGLPIHHGHSK
jgi:uncharacterized iron-regulated membrane protein